MEDISPANEFEMDGDGSSSGGRREAESTKSAVSNERTRIARALVQGIWGNNAADNGASGAFMRDAIVLDSEEECGEEDDSMENADHETAQRDDSGIYDLEDAWNQNIYMEDQSVSTSAIQEVSTSGGWNSELYKETGVLTVRDRLDLPAARMRARNGKL